uniref:Microfibril associated protein 2 n=1 Tax=Equus caballus TaxID=9796 RepID=A0A9L0T4M4_HORSE
MRAACLFLLFLPAGLLAQGQYDLDPLPPFPDHVQYTHYSDQIGKGLAHPQVSPRPATPSRPGSLMCMAQPGPRWGRAMGIAWGGPWLSWDLLCPWGWGLASSPPIPHSSLLSDNPDYYDYQEVTPRPPEEQFQFQSQQQVQQEVIPAPTLEPGNAETEPTEPGPLDCREEQYPCTRLYSIHKPCKQCLNEVCFYSLRRVYVVNKEICVRTVCAHEELLRADLCRDKFSKCGVMASSGLCQSVAASCARSCGGC